MADEKDNYVKMEFDTKGIELSMPISKPDFGSGGKTNEWRIERPVIDQDKCIKCLLCWAFCPDSTIIRHDNDSVDINYDYCKGCGICANECPTKAITMKEEV